MGRMTKPATKAEQATTSSRVEHLFSDDEVWRFGEDPRAVVGRVVAA